MIGELALSGALRPVPGALPAALRARDAGRTLLLPADNGAQAALVEGAEVRPADHLLAVCAHLQDREPLASPAPPSSAGADAAGPDLAEVRGQFQARRALEVAAAGAHSLLFSGPPGSGKTMLASRLPGILPPMSLDEALEVAAISSVSSAGFDAEGWRNRPFRAPHHTASGVALVGGGSIPRPGEISLAHCGVLFLDELPEFDRRVLEVLREPLESGEIRISRAAQQVCYPARFQLVAAMNPCPCGYFGQGRCRCTPDQVTRYQGRISGPLLDRLDLQVEVPALSSRELTHPGEPGESSARVRARVQAAQARQQRRRGKLNSQLSAREAEQDCALAPDSLRLMEQALERLGLSARAYHRVLRVALTLADLDGEDRPQKAHLMEALGYRRQERGLAGEPVQPC